MKTHYDYPEIIKWLEQKGKTDYGTQFHFREADQNNLSKLIAYYLKDEVVATLFDLDLNKGILLTGPIGCGKTSLMSLMKYVTHRDNRFHLKTCRDISFEFIKDGYEVIHRYIERLQHDEGFRARIDVSGHPGGDAWLGLVVQGRDGSVEAWPEQRIRIQAQGSR